MNLRDVKAMLRCVRHTGSDTSKSDATIQIDDLTSSVLRTASYEQTLPQHRYLPAQEDETQRKQCPYCMLNLFMS